jgi:hypothetical protein
MLVDLLKLAVAGRAVDTAKETIVNVLVGTCARFVITCDSPDAGHLGRLFSFVVVYARAVVVPQIRRDCFLPRPVQFIIHKLSCHSLLNNLSY